MDKMCIVDRYKLYCENCINGQDYGDSVEYIWCERLGKRRKSVNYNGQLLTREITEITDYGMYKLYWLLGIPECFTREELE